MNWKKSHQTADFKAKIKNTTHTSPVRSPQQHVARWPPLVWFCAFFFGRNDFRCPETAAEWDLTCFPALTFFTACCPHSFPFLSISAWGSASSTQLKRQTDTKQEESEKLGELRGVWRPSSHSAAVTLICSAAPFLNYCQTRPHRAAFHGFTPGALWETKSVGPLAWTSTTPNQIAVKRGQNELRI